MSLDLAVFKKNYLVVGLSDEDIKRVADLAELKVAKSGEEIVKLGAKGSDLFVILDGKALVCREHGIVLGEHGAGSVIGEIALVDDGPRSAYVTAKNTLTYARLDGGTLRKFMFKNKDVGFIMLSNLPRVMSARLREASATIEDLRGQLIDPWDHSLDQK